MALENITALSNFAMSPVAIMLARIRRLNANTAPTPSIVEQMRQEARY